MSLTMTNDLIQLEHQHAMTSIRIRNLEEEVAMKMREAKKLLFRQMELRNRIELELKLRKSNNG